MTAHARLFESISAGVPEWLLALLMRLGIAGPFFLSGRTKVEGFLNITASTHEMFADEFQVPILPPDLAATAATYAEHILPVLLVLGLLTRPAAFGLLTMTLVIQLFVIPEGWPTHLLWAGPLIYLIARGPGAVSLDRAMRLD